MLKLDTKITLDASVAKSPNLCGRFSPEDLTRIGQWAWEGYELDLSSRELWLKRTQSAMDLALQLQKGKNFPWAGASNVAFPLVTIAAMQFHSRAYPALVSGTDIVKCRVPAEDPNGVATARAELVGSYMSYQVLEEDSAWEEQHDRLLLQIPIVGCAFKKSRYDSRLGHNVSELVPASHLVLDYYAKSVEQCGRKTHVIPFYRNEVYEKCMAGVWRDVLDEPWYTSISAPYRLPQADRADKRTGLDEPQPDESTPITFLEQHCSIDLDGDGYAEPYIVTFEPNNKCVVRIVARWEMPEDVERLPNNRILRIRATEYFTKYGLIPSPDGGIYDLGFGVLLGPLNESVNSLVNQLIDAGTMSNAAGGFLGRGVKIRGGQYQFAPFGWQRVDSTGEELAKGIFPFPVREPSNVLFQLLSFLVNYTQRISGSTDTMVGENPGQNTPAQTTQEMVSQGMKIYSALFKRVWRCMKEEFSKLYVLNARHLPTSRNFGLGQKIGREDFLGDPTQIVPAADPNVTSDTQRLQQAAAIAERARTVPGYNIDEAERRFLRAMHVDGIEQLYTGVEGMEPPKDPKITIAEMKLQSDQMKLQQAQQEFILTLQEEQRVNTATIVKLLADAEAASKAADTAAGGHQVALIQSMIEAAKVRDEALRGKMDLAIRAAEATNARIEAQASLIEAKKPEPKRASA